MLVVFLFAAALAVREDGAIVRSGCEAGDSAIATVRAGSPAQVRFSISGSCYKVSVVSEGKTVEGYLPASALSGTEDFEQSVRSAPTVRATQGAAASAPPAPPPVQVGGGLIGKYQSLVQAGIAAERADRPQDALEYLREAERIQPDRAVQQLIARLEKAMAGDRSNERLYGNRFLLRYEGGALDPEIARNMVALLEQEFTRISGELGCRADERIVTVVQSRDAYRATSDVAEWSAGHFDGARIRIPVAESTAISAKTRETFAHELVHACLANLGTWPTWLHEGMATRLSGRSATSAQRDRIRSMVRSGRLPRLGNVSQSWSRMSEEHAANAYTYAMVAVETFYAMYSGFGIQNVLRSPERFGQVTAALDKALIQ